MHRRPLIVALAVAAIAAAALPLAMTLANPVTGAVFTTVNAGDGLDTCANGNPAINCNIYAAKPYVWLSGGPTAAGLADGGYYFVVLDPGGQNDALVDGAAQNLSSPHDAYTNRTFTVTSGAVTYPGTHTLDGNDIRLFPYDDTDNNGGEYILAVCSLDEGYPADPSSCKYDAFKIKTGDVIEQDLVAAVDATATFTRTFAWGVTKDVAPAQQSVPAGSGATFGYTVNATSTGTDSGWQVSGTASVSNPNAHSVATSVAVSIDDPSASCVVTGGATSIAAGATAALPYTCTYSAAPAAGTHTATATATWAPFGSPSTSATATAPVDFSAGPSTVIDGGAALTDTLAGPWSLTAPGSSVTYDHTFSGDPVGTCTTHGNTATVTASTTSASSSAHRDVVVCVGADLTAAITGTPSFTRTYTWGVTKSVDRTFVRQLGGSATFNYTVTATQTGFVDSGWSLSGNVSVTNPNDWEAVPANIAVTTDNGGTCAVAGTATVAASSTATLPYGCTYASAPSPATGTVSASVTWNATAASTPSGSAGASAPASFVTPTTGVNRTITVNDSLQGVLGSLTGTDGAPFAGANYSYARTVAVPANGCSTIPNTASVNPGGPSASAAVTVCGPIKSGSLTMGFWQNKNGQTIITKGGPTTGTCASTTWLRQYLPFQDLAATSSCAAVAAYVTKIIKAGSAAGTSMNPMLKAQMLATALDVYFSGPGGNKIMAPAPIGGLTIDLTQVCKNIPTCTIWESTTSSFGGSTSLTVSQLLAYASTKSNVGGSAWYAQVKVAQELAKDTFDAINNAVTFSA